MSKPVSNFLHRTPWWALFLLGFSILTILGLFTTPFHVMRLEKSGDSPEMNRAIQREIDSAFGESALGVAERFVGAMQERATDPSRKEELANALREIANARKEMRNVDRDVRQARREAEQAASEAAREALIAAREASKEAATTVVEAQKEALQALKDAGVHDAGLEKQLAESMKAAVEAEAAAQKALEESRKARRNNIVVDLGLGDRPLVDVHTNDKDAKDGVSISIDQDGKATKRIVIPGPAPVAGPAVPVPPAPPVVLKKGAGGATTVPPVVPPVAAAIAGIPAVSTPPLPPALRDNIRARVHDDFYRMGMGAGLILLFIPLFIMAVISKFFIDRSRAAQRLAELKKTEAEYHNMNRQVSDAKLQALQAQVEPHFLYNTLANVQALTEIDPPSANKMVGHLIQYLRSALPKMRENTSTVGQEMELVRAYLNILKMRMGARLEFDIDLPQELAALAFPPLMLPSLVENAIKHGLEPLREGGRIDIGASREGDTLCITVRDTGKGLGQTDTAGSGLGLANIRERLQAIYGDRGQLSLEENEPRGVTATIRIPAGVAPAAPESGAAAGSPAGAASIRPSVATAAAAPGPRPMWRRGLSALGTTERVWRRVLSWTFIVFVIAAAVACAGLLALIYAGAIPFQIGAAPVDGVEGMVIAAVAVLAMFIALVLVGALLVTVGYGLGALLVGLIMFVPILILIGIAPVLFPVAFVIWAIWWWLRSKRRVNAAAGSTARPSAFKAIEIGAAALLVFLIMFHAAPKFTTLLLLAGGGWWWYRTRKAERAAAAEAETEPPLYS